MVTMGFAASVAAEGSSPTPVVAHDTLSDCSEPSTDAERPAWADELTEARDTGHTRFDAQVPSEDGRRVSARTYVPTDYQQPLPTVLILSPYWSLAGLYLKEAEDLGVQPASCWADYLLDRGYAVVLGDMTGTHNSDGCFDYGGPADRADARALVEWIDEQGFSDGEIGMYGVSHVGWSQYMAAASGVEELDAILPVAPVTSWYSYLYDGGVHYETNMATPAAYEYAVAAPPPTNVFQPGWTNRVADTACNTPEPTVYHMQPENGREGPYEARHLPPTVDEFEPAVFHVHGTQDENVKMDHFTQIWDALEDEGVERKALLGPWGHTEPSVDWWNLTALRWFEHHLKGIDTGMMDEPTLTLIDQEGAERHAETFPPQDGRVESLETGGTDALNEGTLSSEAAEGQATYVDNPALHRLALRDAAPHRVVYTSAPLEDPLRVSGTPVAEIAASIAEPDAHLVAYLYEVPEDGEATYVTRGYLDANYRAGVDAEPQPVPAGEPVTYAVDMHAREWVFGEGDRVQLLVSSSDRCPWMLGGSEDLPKCHWSGIVPNDHVTEVTIHEGGQTQLHLPTAPLAS